MLKRAIDTPPSREGGFRELNNIVLLTWQRRGGGMRSGERRGESGSACGSEGQGVGGSSATIEGGEEAAERLWRALRRRQRQCGSGGRGGGGCGALELGRGVGYSAVLEAGEGAVKRRDAFAVFEKTRNCTRCAALLGRSS